MCIGRVKANQLPDPDVFFVVAVDILQEQNVGLLCHIDATAPDFETGGLMQSFSKNFAAIHATIAVIILKNQQFVFQFCFGLPVRIRWHG